MLKINKNPSFLLLYGLAYLINKFYKNKKMSEYIWYCPRSSCNSIIVKTNDPILNRGTSFKCKRCKCDFSSDELTFHNKKNIRKYLDEIDSKVC